MSISLVGDMYKIIVKVLANRMKAVLGKNISHSHSAFVFGWKILDLVLIANECLENWAKVDLLGVLCNLDLEKAYDHVHCFFF